MTKRAWKETEKIGLMKDRDATPEERDEDDDDVTAPHSLPGLMRSHGDPATVQDLIELHDTLWDRISRIKIVSNRRRRDTDKQLQNVSSVPKQVQSLAFKMKIIWGVGAFLLAATAANLIAGARYLYGKGSDDAEQSITMKYLVESTKDHSARIRVIEDASLKMIQRFDDWLNSNRRGRSDASSNASPRGSNP